MTVVEVLLVGAGGTVTRADTTEHTMYTVKKVCVYSAHQKCPNTHTKPYIMVQYKSK